jgi:hypothetical protein
MNDILRYLNLLNTNIMAKQKGVFVTGRWGNIVGSTRYGVGYFRYQPDHINQTAATIESSKMMGIASAMGAAFRREWKGIIPFSIGRQIENRFTGTIKKWLQSQPFKSALPTNELLYLAGFDFNEIDTLKDRVHVPLQIQRSQQDGITLTIPSLVPKLQVGAPAYTTSITWKVAATCYHVASKAIAGTYNTTVDMPYNNNTIPPEVIPLPLEIGDDTVTLVLVSLQYRVKRKGVTTVNNEMRWLPCGIVGGWVE